MLTALHDVPVRRLGETEVGAEESTAQGRDEVDATLSDLAAGTTWPGPYGARLRTLLGEHASVMAATLAEHDRLVAEAWPDSSRHVLSHGEPHPGNLIRTDAGPVLVDWETALLAPPERDLWLLDARSGGRAAELYVEVTGRSLDPRLLERYRLAWALADIGAYLHLLRHSAEETEDTAWSWRALQGTLEDLTVG